jgi:hypothetical protein
VRSLWHPSHPAHSSPTPASMPAAWRLPGVIILVVFLLLALVGCMHVDRALTINGDGSGVYVLTVGFLEPKSGDQNSLSANVVTTMDAFGAHVQKQGGTYRRYDDQGYAYWAYNRPFTSLAQADTYLQEDPRQDDPNHTTPRCCMPTASMSPRAPDSAPPAPMSPAGSACRTPMASPSRGRTRPSAWPSRWRTASARTMAACRTATPSPTRFTTMSPPASTSREMSRMASPAAGGARRSSWSRSGSGCCEPRHAGQPPDNAPWHRGMAPSILAAQYPSGIIRGSVWRLACSGAPPTANGCAYRHACWRDRQAAAVHYALPG